MIEKTDLRILSLMIEKCGRLVEIMNSHSKEEIKSNYVLSDAIQYEFEKLYEDSTRLSMLFRIDHNDLLHIDALRGIRNRVAHNYESVILDILFDTIKNDIPIMKRDLETILETINQDN